MTSEEITKALPMPHYRPPLRERIRVYWQNWKVRHVGKAIRVLSKAIQDDPGYRQTWHANIAMPIYDSVPHGPTPMDECRQLAAQVWCVPSTSKIAMNVDLAEEFATILHIQSTKPKLSITHANEIADKLLKHFFNA